MTTFEFQLTEEFLLEALGRYHQSQNIVARFPYILVALGGIAALWFGLTKFYVGVAFMVPPLAFIILFSTPWFNNFRLRRSLRKSPYYDQRLRIQLSDDGQQSFGEISNTQSSWAAFTAARRFSDGFLLIQGPYVSQWLPFSAITAGSVDEADHLIRRHVVDYKEV